MSREEVFRASGPTSGANVLGQAGRHQATGKHRRRRRRVLKYQAGCLPGLARTDRAAMCAFAPYDARERASTVGYDVVSEPAQGRGLPRPRRPHRGVRSRVDARRARPRARPRPGGAAPAQRGAGGQPVELRPEIRSDRDGGHSRGSEGPSALSRAPGTQPGRGVATGFWFNIGGETCATMNVNEDGTVGLMTGTPDIGAPGLRSR